jgi:hypothetical protein
MRPASYSPAPFVLEAEKLVIPIAEIDKKRNFYLSQPLENSRTIRLKARRLNARNQKVELFTSCSPVQAAQIARVYEKSRA